MEDVWFALLLTTIAGLSTGIGALIAYFIKKPKMSYLSFGLGLSAGVMIYISFMELLPLGIEAIGELKGLGIFFFGMLCIALIDTFVPQMQNSHHVKSEEGLHLLEEKDQAMKSKLMKTGMTTAISLGIHNFPEGLATFGTALNDISLGILIMVAIAIHNIPEGISVSIPIYYATGDKKKAFKISFLSGLSEPIGAIIGYLILRPYINDALIGGMLAFVAGIMVYISIDEILPTAFNSKEGHHAIAGVVIGMMVMALSLILIG